MKRHLLMFVTLVFFFVLAFSVSVALDVSPVSAATKNEVASPIPEIEQFKAGMKKQAPPVTFNCTNWDKWMCLCLCIFCCKD